MTIIFNRTEMNIPAKLEDLYKSLGEQLEIRDKARGKIKELTLQIKKLRTIAKHAEELFAEQPQDEMTAEEEKATV